MSSLQVHAICKSNSATSAQILWIVFGVLFAQVLSLMIWMHTWRTEEQDFFAFYSGAHLGLSGQNPYNNGTMIEEQRTNHRIAGRKGDSILVMFFSPPEALVVFAPFSKLPWRIASFAWLSFQISLALGLSSLAWTFGGVRQPKWLGPTLALAFLLNPLTYRLLALGQCTLVIASVIALGQWAFEARRPFLGVTLWGLTAIKPQLAIPFLALAFVLGGWRRLVGIIIVIGSLNILGCLITTGTPYTLIDYVRFVTENHLIGLNRVDQDQVCSWNHVVYVLGGPAWDLTAVGMIASHAVWMILIWLRHGCPKIRSWVPAYVLSAAAIGSVFCAVSHGYDLVILALLAPLIIARYQLGQRREAALLVGLMAMTTIPRNIVKGSAELLSLQTEATELMLSYRSLILAVLAVYLLVRGQTGLQNGNGSESDDLSILPK